MVCALYTQGGHVWSRLWGEIPRLGLQRLYSSCRLATSGGHGWLHAQCKIGRISSLVDFMTDLYATIQAFHNEPFQVVSSDKLPRLDVVIPEKTASWDLIAHDTAFD